MYDCPDCTGYNWQDKDDYDYCKPCIRCGREDGIAVKGRKIVEISVTDVMKMLDFSFAVDGSGTLIEITPDGNFRIAKFNLSKPLSDPDNAAACEAVYQLIKDHE
jgi:hypothetical protein